MAKVNFQDILVKVAKSPKAKRAVLLEAKEFLREHKDNLIEEFLDHPVTQELQDGPNKDGSDYLPGGYGNLFSFIGFYEDDDPIKVIERILKQIKLHEETTFYRFGPKNTLELGIRIENIPTLEEIYNATPFPDGWRNGSWVQGISKGIPGFRSYLYDEEFNKYTQSRSTTGLQARVKGGEKVIIIRDGAYRPTEYIAEILRNFNENIRRFQ